MTWQLTLIVFFGLLMFALLSGMALPAAFMAISGTAAFIFWGGFSGLEQMSLTLLNTVKTWSLLPIPLFILMGEILFQTGIMKRRWTLWICGWASCPAVWPSWACCPPC